MCYLIATMEDIQGDLILTIGRCGNKITIELYNKETEESTIRKFDNLTEAYKVFEKLSSWIVFSLYSEKSKRQFLSTGTMD